MYSFLVAYFQTYTERQLCGTISGKESEVFVDIFTFHQDNPKKSTFLEFSTPHFGNLQKNVLS